MAKQMVIELPEIDIREMRVRIVGDTSLIVHAWSEKARKQMLNKQQGKAKAKKNEPKDPQADYQASLYRQNGHYAFPARAIKKAMVTAANDVGIAMTQARRMCFIVGDLIPLEGKPKMREDMVRLARGVADIRYRGEFVSWAMALTIRYNAGVCTAEQIANLLNLAGTGVGIGEWRPEKSGTHGMFHVERKGER